MHASGPARCPGAGIGGLGHPNSYPNRNAMTEEVPMDGIQLVVAELLRGKPVVARWEDLEAVGTTPADWLYEVRDVASRADIKVKSSELTAVRMTAVFNAADEPAMEAVQDKVNTLLSGRKVREAMAEALAQDLGDGLAGSSEDEQ